MSTRATERHHGADVVVRRRALWASAATGAGAVFTLVDYTPLNFVVVDGRIAVLLLLLAAVGAVGALLHQKIVMIGVGAILLLLAVFRMVTYGHGDGLVGGGSSTAALFAGLGMIWVGIAMSRPGDPSQPLGARLT